MSLADAAMYLGVITVFSSFVIRIIRRFHLLRHVTLKMYDIRVFLEMSGNSSEETPDEKQTTTAPAVSIVGQKLAVVVRNGSGKTTMIKLLCQLYDPTEGVILLNGIDIRSCRPDEYRALFSVVFQDSRRLQKELKPTLHL